MMNYSASGGIGEEGPSIVDSEAGNERHTPSVIRQVTTNMKPSQLLMPAEPIKDTELLKTLSVALGQCSNRVLSKTETSEGKMETIPRQMRLEDAFHQSCIKLKKKKIHENLLLYFDILFMISSSLIALTESC